MVTSVSGSCLPPFAVRRHAYAIRTAGLPRDAGNRAAFTLRGRCRRGARRSAVSGDGYRCRVTPPLDAGSGPLVLVIGDLALDVVLTAHGPLRRGTDVLGNVAFRQGGSAATTARRLAALGCRAVLITAVGPDAAGDALVTYMASCGVRVEARRVPGAPTGRLGVLVEPGGERSFVSDRGAMLRMRASDVPARAAIGADALHVPAYSLVGRGPAAASVRLAALARAAGALVSIDLASAGFLQSEGPGELLARVASLRPDVLFATEAEAAETAAPPERLLDLSPLVVLKQGSAGAQGLRRGRAPVAVPARSARVTDSTGAGDAFDAGFIARWLACPDPRNPTSADLRAALAAGHRAALREIRGTRVEFSPSLALRQTATGRDRAVRL